MKLYVYADESGTFDKAHNDLFVYGGLVVMGKQAKDNLERKYLAVERSIKASSDSLGKTDEAKACKLSMRERKRLFHVIEMAECRQFAFIVNQKQLRDAVFLTKQTRQRYLDWALKMGIKECICSLMHDGAMRREDVNKMDVFVDEHSSSTAGKYNLTQSINEEFRLGIYNPETNHAFPPVFGPIFPEISVNYLNSASVTLIRVADITANWLYCAVRDKETYPAALAAIIKRGQVKMCWHPF